MNKTVALFKSGVYNLLSPEKIPDDAAQDSSNFVTKDGKVVLVYGRKEKGTQGSLGNTGGIHAGYTVDGTQVLYCKFGTAIKYWDGSAWQDCITGLTDGAEYTFSNYSSLAGAFTFVNGIDGYWKIINANPDSPIDVYSSTKNFKGYILVDRGRTILWNREDDKTGFYGSWIDRQDSTVYTAVSSEATTSLTGTLAFKAGGAYRSCFALQITLTGTGEVFTDNFDGTLTGSISGTGTINYATGAYTLSNAGVGTADYQWEDSTDGGVCDFSKSATRLAGEGFQFPQDVGGDAILNVEVGQDGAYYSLKEQSAYRLSIDADDLGADNQVYRQDMGLPNFRASVSSNRGIVFMNTANPTNPEMTILQKNKVSLDVEPVVLLSHFDFSKYTYDDACLSVYDKWIIVFCKSSGVDNNDTMLMCDLTSNTVDIVNYSGKMSTQIDNILYVADSITETVYEVFSGFDDLGLNIDAYWEGKEFKLKPSNLVKVRRLKFKGHIDPDQVIEVYFALDSSSYSKAGEIRGDESYVNYDDTLTIGSQMVGEDVIGGEVVDSKYGYYMQLKLKTGKFRTISLKLIPTGIGYFDFDIQEFWDILTFDDRLPKSFRTKQ